MTDTNLASGMENLQKIAGGADPVFLAREAAAVLAEIERLRGDVASLNDGIAALTRTATECAADAERLDWLLRRGYVAIPHGAAMRNAGRGVRYAIDEAMGVKDDRLHPR